MCAKRGLVPRGQSPTATDATEATDATIDATDATTCVFKGLVTTTLSTPTRLLIAPRKAFTPIDSGMVFICPSYPTYPNVATEVHAICVVVVPTPLWLIVLPNAS